MSTVGRRYARALFALAKEDQQLESVGQQIAAAAELLQQPDVAGLAGNPLLTASRRNALVDAVSEQLRLTPLTAKFLHFLADRSRLDQMASIADQYQNLEDRDLGRVRLHIRCATDLPERQRDRIADVFASVLSKKVLAEIEVDSSLLGGVIVEAEGKVYDGSVRTQLSRLAKQMARSDSH